MKPCFASQRLHAIPGRSCSRGPRNKYIPKHTQEGLGRQGSAPRRWNLLLASQYPLFPLQTPPIELQISQARDKCTCLDIPGSPGSCSHSCPVELLQWKHHRGINNFVFPAPPAGTGRGWQSLEGSSGPAAHSHITQASSCILSLWNIWIFLPGMEGFVLNIRKKLQGGFTSKISLIKPSLKMLGANWVGF